MVSGERPESSIARSIARKAYLQFMPMKRSCLRSMSSSGAMSGRPQMLDFMPISLYFSLTVIPGLHSCSEVATSSTVLPRHEMMPMPVTTTRLPSMATALARLAACMSGILRRIRPSGSEATRA